MAPKAAVKKVAAKAAKAASPKGHGKGPDAVPAGGGAAAGIGGTAISVEQQGRNAAHYAQVAEWRDTIYGHDLFSDIGRALPLSIADSGTQHPFDAGDFAIAIARDAGSYTAGINLFWCEPLYSPAPSIPIRTDTIPDLVEVYFSTPAVMPHPVYISLRPGECPLTTRGSLMAINPEEMRHAMMSAIARDIEAGVDTAVLEQWRTRVLSCTGTFVVHASDASRLQMAMQLRENIANDHETMSRTQLQRVYEVIFFRDVWARTHGRDQASAANIAGEYAKVKMANGREKVSKSFVDTALTIHSRLLSIPAAETLLLDMDSALPRDCNPFNSVHRLQAIISKCGNSSTSSRDNTLWVLRHIRHMILDLNADPTTSDFSVDGLRGNNKTNNRGLVDVILLKKEALGYLCHKLPIQLGIEGDSTWLAEIQTSLKSHDTYLASQSGDGLTWRNRLSPAQSRYVAFAEDLLYGSRHDHHLKALLRAGKTCTSIETFPGLCEALDDVKSLLATEQTEDQKADADDTHADIDCMPDCVLKVFQASDTDSKKDPQEINVADLGEDDRAEWLRARDYLRQQISNYVHIIALDNAGDLTVAIRSTPAGTFEGGCKVGGRTRFVGVVWDSRVMGESSARPSVRMPPLQIQEVHRLFECIRARHDRADTSPKTLHPYDLYISLSGGRDLGAQFQKWFTTMGPPAAASRNVHVFLDPVSVQDRFDKVRGVASNRTHDCMRLTAAPWPRLELKTIPRIHYSGTNASDSIGPVVLGQVSDEETWTLTWAQKKLLYGTRGLIAVGGRGDVVDDGPDDQEDADDAGAASAAAQVRRTDDTREMAFYHALPSAFWDEVVHDYQLGAILDVAVGDGSLALTAVRNRIAYTGLCFTTHHKDMVMSRLLDLMSAGSLKAGDKWYDPNLVKTLLGASKKNKATVDPDGSVAPKKKPKPNPKGPKDPKDPKDPKGPKGPKDPQQKPKKKPKGKAGHKKDLSDGGSGGSNESAMESEEEEEELWE